ISKQKLSELIANKSIILYVEKNYKDKYGRVLGTIFVSTININDYLVNNNYAVKYEGENKSNVKDLHLKNRQILIDRKELIM
ncbi:MAG TPA: thermonuclease family protein, partial [Allocoleopsis sp.]